MEDMTVMKEDEPHEEEEISDKFLCRVCLELLYKPIVILCGHLSYFWCVHSSMSGLRVSHCPICRDPYLHFPTVCQKVHFLLKKLYPIAHNKREAQLLSYLFFGTKKKDIEEPASKEIAAKSDSVAAPLTIEEPASEEIA
ncbi:unnamed protein product [Eruca vesicaria subsp. sativa]|uniref:RING-type domain-containing protein n=1 Tax=Eruca vesicaria subsp. sativa TaxID=29727 RepID=A0ABC8M8W7_ERUVS|nr:unnamed protein product [Eruca vesicaria subsp. sativa]